MADQKSVLAAHAPTSQFEVADGVGAVLTGAVEDGGHIVAESHTAQQLQTTWRAGPWGEGGKRSSSSGLAGPVEDAGVASSGEGRR